MLDMTKGKSFAEVLEQNPDLELRIEQEEGTIVIPGKAIDTSLIEEQERRFENVKLGQRHIELASRGWIWEINVENRKPWIIEAVRDYKENPETRVCIEPEAYDMEGNVVPSHVGVYSMTSSYGERRRLDPEVPKELMREARKIRKLGRRGKLDRHLNSVYFQIVQRQRGEYSLMLQNNAPYIGMMLNYIADKMRKRGMEREADGIELVLLSRGKKDYHIPPKRGYHTTPDNTLVLNVKG